jgi:hypothetical protein
MRHSLFPVRQFRWTRLSLLAVSLLCPPSLMSAQVGHRPSESPFQDVKLGHNLTASAGYMWMEKDPAGVAPKSAGYGQLRYDAAVGGPASLFARWIFIPSSRALKAPGAILSQQITDYPKVVTHIFDGGIDISLTGNKSWHRLLPSLYGGMGMVSDFASPDSGGYQFGNKFEFSFGFVTRYVHPSGLRLRMEASTHAWQYDYPNSYYIEGPNGGAIVVNTVDRSVWGNNWALSAGASFPIFR